MNELGGSERLEATMEVKRTVSMFCISSAGLAIRLARRSERREAQKLIDVRFVVSLDVEGLC